jgi:hypothetical protein
MIKSVYGFAIDCCFMYDGNLYQVKSFPTRRMVCGDLLHEFMQPCPFQVKVAIHEVVQLEHMDWAIEKGKEERKKWLKQSGKK